MAYFDFLKDTLRPLRLYDLDEGFGAVELQVAGDILDRVYASLLDAESEARVETAEDYGISGFETILPSYELPDDIAMRRETIFSLMRIDGRSHTIAAIRDMIRCFGIDAELDESPGEDSVTIRFPGVHGAPRGFDSIKWLMSMVMPCHLEIFYDLIRSTWADLESKLVTWAYVESRNMTWNDFEGI